jgi:hypothetical protein
MLRPRSLGSPEPAAELDSNTHDRDAAPVAERVDQRAVELDLIRRESLEAAQRGVAGPEIVQRELHLGDVAVAGEIFIHYAFVQCPPTPFAVGVNGF